MATLTKTISNRISVSGPTPTNKWGTMLWGQNWGESKDGILSVNKLLSNVLTFTDAFQSAASKLISNTIVFRSGVDFVSLSDGSGYKYVFPDNTTDPDNRYFPTWTEHSDPGTDYDADERPDTTWSDV